MRQEVWDRGTGVERRGWLCPGATCWRKEPARRAALLHDGAAYFAAANGALLRARHSVLLIGWSFHPRAVLAPSPDGVSEGLTIAQALRRLRAERPEVTIRLLIWDMPWPISSGKDLNADEICSMLGEDIDYRIDSCLPYGACQHQKILIVDDAIAFCGGTDFESDRWDTTAHRDEDPRRRLPNGEIYTPRHDVMMLVDGAAAHALGELARERWRAATGETLPVATPDRDAADHDPWPKGLAPAFEDLAVAIARTVPASKRAVPDYGVSDHGSRSLSCRAILRRTGIRFGGTRSYSLAIRESEALYLTAIAGARSVIYLENQYFASRLIADALAARLSEPDGPEVIVVVAESSPNFFDKMTMDNARRSVIVQLRAADPFDRLRILAPRTDQGTPIVVHSKVAVFDDRLVRVGSSNLNNRSFGYDSECDLAIEAMPGADEARHRHAVKRCLHALVAHHAAIHRDDLEQAVAERGSIRAVLDEPALVSPRRLSPVMPTTRGPLSWLLAWWVDQLKLGDPVGMEDAWCPWRRAAALRRLRARAERAQVGAAAQSEATAAV